MRAPLAAAIALVLIACSFAPSSAGTMTVDQARALALINTPCLVAQNGSPSPSPSPSGSPAPSPSPSPSASPTAAGIAPPLIPAGPGVLVPPPLPTSSPPVTPPPLVTPTPVASPGSPAPVYITPVISPPPITPPPHLVPGPITQASPSPSPTPAPGETLGPNDYAVLGDRLTGNRSPGQPFDLDGNVNVIYEQGTLVGDHAHYDGGHYIDVTGHAFLINAAHDAMYSADSIRFDTQTQHATMINGRGVTTEGVSEGRLHFNAQNMVTDRNGVAHGTRASLTTCENPHGGYHIEAKTIDITPGEQAIARHAVLFLGPLAILYLPVLIIPLRHTPGTPRRRNFVPQIGYSQAEGFYIKAQIGFGTTPWYYGYYRLEYYTKIGYGLGYVGSFRRKDGKRALDVDFFRLYNRTDGSSTWNADLNDQEIISPALRATARGSYQADYGPLINLPASLQIALGLTKSTPKDVENYSFSRQETSGESSTNNYGISDNYTFDPKLSNALTATYTTNMNNNVSPASVTTQLHFNTDTHWTTSQVDYDLIVDKYDSTTPSSVNKLPELLIRPHQTLDPHLKFLPITGTFTLGDYDDPLADLTTQRFQANITVGPLLAHTPIGDVNAQMNVQQNFYGTGDAKAQITEQATLNTPISDHFYNTVSFSAQHINGLGDEPFTWDTIGGSYQNAQDVFKVYNKDVYALILQTGTAFNRMAQPVQYQLLTRPSPRSSIVIGGNWTPGAGNGFDRTGVQVSTPVGKYSDIQFSTFVDWKNKGRLESKQVYFRQIIGDCYEVRVSYNEDLKTVNVTVDILAFPSQALNFGLGQTSSIIPQSFASSQFFTGQ